MYEQLLQGVAGAMGSGSKAMPTLSGATSTGSTVTIAPQGINLGAILQPLQEGNSNTGGYDVSLLSRLGYGHGGNGPVYQAASPGFFDSLDVSQPSTWILGGVGMLAILLLIKKRR